MAQEECPEALTNGLAKDTTIPAAEAEVKEGIMIRKEDEHQKENQPNQNLL